LRIDNHIWFSCSRAAECLTHSCSSLFFLDLWRDPSGFRYFMLYGFQLCCTVLCALVPACGSAVIWRPSRSLCGFSDFSPTLGRIHALLGIKHLPAVGKFWKTRHPRNIKFNEVLEICFSGAGHSRFSGILDLRSLRFANMRFSGILSRRRLGVMNTRKPGTSNWQSHEFRRTANSGVCRESGSEVMRGEIHEPEKKQSQSYRPKKSGFRVWTSGRLVNMWDEKDIVVCVHIRNILWARGRFRNVKVPSAPYKRGREGTCKWIQTFGTCAAIGRFTVSFRLDTVFEHVENSLSLSC
jgi:hypothetical protein